MDVMEHMTVAEGQEPLRELPEDVSGKFVVIQCTSAIGDAVITVGSVAKKLSEMGAKVAAAVKPHQIPLISKLKGVQYIFPSTQLNDPKVRFRYDVVLNLGGAMVNSREILDQEYYTSVWKEAGLPGEPEIGSFVKDLGKSTLPLNNLVALHTSSSNPIRRWPQRSWKQLAYALRHSGYRVVFLGSKEDYGFNDEHIIKLSDENLLHQAQILRDCTAFVGNDSAFAHIAGLLGVPGVVIFSATKPEHVIARYPSLKSVDIYEELGVEPSRSLRNYDPNAIECMNNISTAEVFSTLALPTLRELPISPAKTAKLVRFIPFYKGAGDVIMATAVLKKAKEKYPAAEIAFQCKPQFSCLLPDFVTWEPLGESDADADEEISLSYYDCWRDGESALERMGGIAGDMFLPDLPTMDVSEKSVGFWVRQGSNPNKIKEWNDEYWKELAYDLSRQGYTCYQLGGVDDELILSGDIKDLRREALLDSLGTLAAVDVVVTIDGVAQHACRAMNKQAIVLWGGSCTPEVIGYPEHINILTDSGKKCWGSVCQSTFQQGNCCGDGSCVDAATGAVQWHVKALMDHLYLGVDDVDAR